jgi:hypothetical protein
MSRFLNFLIYWNIIRDILNPCASVVSAVISSSLSLIFICLDLLSLPLISLVDGLSVLFYLFREPIHCFIGPLYYYFGFHFIIFSSNSFILGLSYSSFAKSLRVDH